MGFSLRSNSFTRCFYITSRRYCENKSIYQRDEEGKQPRKVHGQLYPEWRKPWISREGEWSSKLSIFVEKNPSPYIMNALQKLPYLDFQQVKDWWANMKTLQEIHNQKYIPERVGTLGANLAAVHFFTFRQAAVRLKHSSKWISGNPIELEKELPHTFVDGYQVEAVDCTNFHHNGIRYEGLQNLTGLNYLKWLCLKNNKHIDVWCLDRIAGQNGETLEYLDISDCTLDISCIMAIARMSALKMLIIKDPGNNLQIQAALSILEQERPKLIVKSVDVVISNS